jgi:hypothetical protein
MIPIFLDNNAFDFFLNRNIDLLNVLPAGKYELYITPEVEDEIENISNVVLKDSIIKYIQDNNIKTHSYFGYVSAEDIREDGNVSNKYIAGYSSAETFHTDCGTIASAEVMDFFGRDKETCKIKYNNEIDSLLASRSIIGIVLTCDNKRILRTAREKGHRIVLLGKTNPLEDGAKQCGFDASNKTLEEFILGN